MATQLELGQLWTRGTESGFAGVSPGRRMLQLHSPPGASPPLRPFRPLSCGDFLFHKTGRLALPSEDAGRSLWCCGSTGLTT